MFYALKYDLRNINMYLTSVHCTI